MTLPVGTDATNDATISEVETAIEPGVEGAVPLSNSQSPNESDSWPARWRRRHAGARFVLLEIEMARAASLVNKRPQRRHGHPTNWHELAQPALLSSAATSARSGSRVRSTAISSNDIDMFGGVFAGCDWDHYWGTELAINRATPEIINETARDAERGDMLMEETLSLMYYPWGDSLFRPYWRFGIGATEIDFPTDDGLAATKRSGRFRSASA